MFKNFMESTVKKCLNEMSSPSISLFSKEDVFEALADVFLSEWYDIYPGYSQPVDEDEETFFNTEEQAINFASIVNETFESLPNPIPIYRTLYAKTEEDIDLEYLGESWSFVKESAIAFGSHNGSNYLISATIDKRYVNWEKTLKTFVIFSGTQDSDDENEIVVSDETKIDNIVVKQIKWKKN